MKLSDYLADFLVRQKVYHVFQVIGGASVHMVHSIAANKKLSYICVQHEQAGAMAAEAYSRMTKNLGAAMATSGPGMTNLITGIACAYFDSTPVLYITGQVNINESKEGRAVRQVGFQETDIVDIVKPVTKYAIQITDPALVRYYLEKAVYEAKSGRPGPVLIDIPMNIQRAEINPVKLKGFKPPKQPYLDTNKTVVNKIDKALELLQKAKRPVLIAGGGIRYADQTKIFLKIATTMSIPVVSTWSGIDVLSHDHRLYRGQIGVYGNRGANFTIQNSDFFMSLGTRLDTRITGGKPETFARGAKKVVVDIDRSEIYKRRGLNPDIGIVADLREMLPILSDRLKKYRTPNADAWKSLTKTWMGEYPNVLPAWRKRKTLVDPYVFVETLSGLTDPHAIVFTDCGANLTWTIQAYHVRASQRLISAMGNSPMGYSMAASMGASIALGKKPVIAIIGDGGFQINIQELQTIVHYKIPLKIFVLNNNAYGIIMQFQDMYFNSNYQATIPKYGYSAPDITRVALAYGIPSVIIRNHKELNRGIRKVLAHKGPIICNVMVPQHAKLIPKLEFGNPIEDLSPVLSDNEFYKHMLIPALPRT